MTTPAELEASGGAAMSPPAPPDPPAAPPDEVKALPDGITKDDLVDAFARLLKPRGAGDDVSKGDLEVAMDYTKSLLDRREEMVEMQATQKLLAAAAQDKYAEGAKGLNPLGLASRVFHRACAIDKQSSATGLERVREVWKQHGMVFDEKSLNITTAVDGGINLQGEIVESAFGPLLEQSFFLQANPRSRTFSPDGDGTIELIGIETIPTATWLGEEGSSTADYSGMPTFGDRTMSRKWMMLLLPMTDVWSDSRAGRRQNAEVERHIIDQMFLTRDVAWLQGAGTQFQPWGLVLRALDATVGNNSASAGTTAANIRTDIATVANHMATNNVPDIRPATIMHNTRAINLQYVVVDTQDRLVFQAEINAGSFAGRRLVRTNQILATRILHFDAAQIVVGLPSTVRVQTFDQGSFVHEGETKLPIQQRLKVMRFITDTDIGVLHNEAVYLITGASY